MMRVGADCGPLVASRGHERAEWARQPRTSRGVEIVDTEAVEALLARAKQAHGVFEETELQGVYDQDWPRWYATYAVEHGIGALVGRAITIDELAEFLASSNAVLQQIAPELREPWAAYTARRITAEL